MKKSRIIPLVLLGMVMVVMVAIIIGKKVSITAVTGDWTILTSEESKEAAKILKKSMEATDVANVSVVTEFPEDWNGRLILVGETQEAASQEAVLSLKDGEYLVEFGKEYVVIVGSTVEKTVEAVNYVCETHMSYLEEYHDLPYGSSYDYVSANAKGQTATGQILLDGVSIHRYQIVATDGADSEAATYLQNAVKNMIGVEMEIVSEQDSESYGIEIQSGETGAAKELKDQQFRIYQEGTKLYLCASDEEDELQVVKMLLTKYMGYEYLNEASTLATIEVNDVDFKYTCNWSEFTAPEVVQARALYIPSQDGYNVLQGACTDGTYAYYIINNQTFDPYINRIYKVKLETLEVVEVSETLQLQHANSITYNSKTGELMCVNYDPDKNVITYIDPETLKMTGTREVEFNAVNMEYSEEKDAYVAGARGTFDFFVLNNELEIQNYHDSIQTTATKQEVSVYGDTLLFGMSDPNVIYAYNWEGEFLYTIDLGLYAEYENLIFYEDTAFIGYYSAGGLIYEAIFYQEIQ